MARDVQILGPMIRLGQLLKLSGVADSGSDTKAILAGGEVRVNDEPESRRGRQLHEGDVVQVGHEALRVATRP
ncbi:MAG: RNA-binding S4 domain-containing protein [Thermoleophilaceae bacterium]